MRAITTICNRKGGSTRERPDQPAHPGLLRCPTPDDILSIESIAPDDIQGAAEGVYFFENFPRMLKAKDDERKAQDQKEIVAAALTTNGGPKA